MGVFQYLRNNKGQSMVEMALVLPVLMLLLFGILEFGLVFHEYLVVTAAAREGARTDAIGSDYTVVENAVKEAARTVDRGSLDIVFDPVDETARVYGDPVTVRVRNPIQITTPLISAFFPQNPYIIESAAIMRYER